MYLCVTADISAMYSGQITHFLYLCMTGSTVTLDLRVVLLDWLLMTDLF